MTCAYDREWWPLARPWSRCPEPLTAPLRWRKPAIVRVAVLGDLFDDARSDEIIDKVFGVMVCAKRHMFQVLTKRPERMRAYLSPTNGTGNVLSRVLKAAQQLPKPRGFVSPEMVFPPWGEPTRYWPTQNIHFEIDAECSTVPE